MKFFLLVATGLAALLDFSMGASIVFAVYKFLGIKPELWHYFVGGLLALGPDFDFLYFLITSRKDKSRQQIHHHAFIPHRPIVMIPLVVVAAYFFGGTIWAQITGLCFFWHYLHDTKGLGGSNMAWLWPFIKKPISLWPLGIERNAYSMESMEDHHQWLIENYIELNRQSCFGLIFSFVVLATITTDHFGLDWIMGVTAFVVLVLVLYNFRNIYKATR